MRLRCLFLPQTSPRWYGGERSNWSSLSQKSRVSTGRAVCERRSLLSAVVLVSGYLVSMSEEADGFSAASPLGF